METKTRRNQDEKVRTPLVLAVDDQRVNLKILENTLKKEGYEFCSAHSGAEALLKVRESMPDLILLDIMLPDMDGYAVCKKLKASPEFQSIPIIFITAKVDSESVVEGFEVGGADYVSKPYCSAELKARVKNQINLKLSEDAQVKLIGELEQALQNLDTLGGLIPICSCCKKIRDDGGYWQAVESYIASQSSARFSHGLCPNCADQMLEEYELDVKDK